MKFRTHRISILFIVVLFVFSNMLTVTANEITHINKDETVYTMLNHDGSIQNTKIVNRLYNIQDNYTTDFGPYLEITPLRKASAPEVGNGRIVWDTSEYIGKDFYYEGLIEKELPILIDIKYYLNNDEINASELAGKSGEVRIAFDINKNPNCTEVFKDSFMTQIQLMLDLDEATITNSDDATKTITGKYANLAYTILPNESKSFELTMETNHFELEPISIALIQYEASFDGVNDLTDGLTTMKDGMVELADGTNKLQNGMIELRDGIKELNDGFTDLSNGISPIKNGMSDYIDGLDKLDTGIESLASGLNDTTSGLKEINDKSSIIVGGYEQLYEGLDQLKTGQSQLALLANSLLADPDPNVQALAQGIIAQSAGLEEITAGFSKSNEGLKEYTAGLNKITTGVNEINLGFSALPNNVKELLNGYTELYNGCLKIFGGINETKEGVNKLNNQVDTLPSEVGLLADGQKELSDGLIEFHDKVNENFMGPEKADTISFSDESITINSLQFIMKTPKIEVEEVEEIIDEAQEKLPWYEEFWNKFKGLFS